MLFFTGKMISFMYKVLCMFIAMTFFCNLQAVLIHQDYEDPIDTVQDVIQNDKTVFMTSPIAVNIFNK